MGTDEYVPWQWHESTEEAIKLLKEKSYTIYGIETSKNSKEISKVELSYPCAFVFGNERHGISHHILTLCDQILHLPLYGIKNSLNVGFVSELH